MVVAILLNLRRQSHILDKVYSTCYNLALNNIDDHTSDLAALDELISHIKLNRGKYGRIRAMHSESIKYLVKLYIDDCDLPSQKTMLGYCMLLDRDHIESDQKKVGQNMGSVNICKFLITFRHGLYDGSYDRDHR